jgi:hypothetical protein
MNKAARPLHRYRYGTQLVFSQIPDILVGMKRGRKPRVTPDPVGAELTYKILPFAVESVKQVAHSRLKLFNDKKMKRL